MNINFCLVGWRVCYACNTPQCLPIERVEIDLLELFVFSLTVILNSGLVCFYVLTWMGSMNRLKLGFCSDWMQAINSLLSGAGLVLGATGVKPVDCANFTLLSVDRLLFDVCPQMSLTTNSLRTNFVPKR